MRPGLRLTLHFGERDRDGRGFLADRVMEAFAGHPIAAGALLRGAEGFGLRHRLQTGRLLTISDDLPLAAVAAGDVEAVLRLAEDLRALTSHGLLTLERVRLGAGERAAEAAAIAAAGGDAQLTIWLERGARLSGRGAHEAAVAAFRAHGADAATVLLGVDGVLGGSRRRARLRGGNSGVPLLVRGIGPAAALASAASDVCPALGDPPVTLERVTVLRRAGAAVAEPPPLPARDRSGLGLWRRITVHASEQARFEGRPLHVELVRALRAAGVDGATAVRGIWGFAGDARPAGDRLGALRRRVPVSTVTIAPPGSGAWEVVERLASSAGLVTSEIVPAARASAPGTELGGLRLADPP